MIKKKRGLKLGLFLVVVLISLWCVASVGATDYYINATTGNDSLAGTSPATAWKTISKVNGETFNASDNIYFERGEEWREQLTVPSSGNSTDQITFGAYGSGNKPIVSGMREVSGWDTAENWATGGWETAFYKSLIAENTNTGLRNYRNEIPADSADNGTKIRLTIRAGASGSYTFNGTSIGLMTTDDVFDYDPTTWTADQGIRVTWDTGNYGDTVPAGETLLSDEMTLNYDKTKRYGVHIYMLNREYIAYTGSGQMYYDSLGDDTLVQDASLADGGTSTYGIQKVEVYTGGGAENVWTLNLATDPQRLVIDGTEYLEAETLEDVDSTYRWFHDSGILYLYATENPADAYSSMEYSANVHGISMTVRSYITIQDLEVKGGIWSIAILDASSHILIHDCTVGQYAYNQGIRLWGKTSSPYTQITDVEIYDNVIDGDYHNAAIDWDSNVGQDGVFIGSSVASCKVYNNTITDWAHSCVVISGTMANCETQYNEVFLNNLSAPNTNYCRGIDINNGGVTGQAAYNKVYQNLIFDTTVRNQIVGDHNEFYYNIIYNVTQGARSAGVPGGIGMFGSSGKVCHDNKVYNNVIYNVEHHGIHMLGDIGFGDVQANLMRNNIIMNWGAGRYGISITDHAAVLDNTYQNNLLYKSGVSDVVDYRGTLRTIAEFNGENGSNDDIITDNIGGDPLFTNASGYMNTSTDFQLQWNSLAIDNGTDVGLTQDYEGNTVPQGSAPDIGAYEYNAPGGVNYYVNATTGNDSLAGTTPATAWKTISKINGETFFAGDNIYFERGEEWREQLTIPSSGNSTDQITFGAYGSGNLPKILGSIAKNSVGDWTDEGGNLWYASSTVEIMNLIMDSEASMATMVAAKVNLDTQGEAWYDDPNDRIYIYSVGNPATYYSGSIECARNSWLASVDNRDYITFEYLDFRYTGNNGVVFRDGSYGIIDNCVIRFTGNDLSGDSHWNGAGINAIRQATSTISNNTISYTFKGIYANADSGAMAILIEDNIISHSIGVDGHADGILFGDGDYAGSIVQRNDISTFTDDGIDMYHGINIIAQNNVIHDSVGSGEGNGIKMGMNAGQTGNQALRNHIYNLGAGSARQGIRTNGAKDGVIAYNIIHDVLIGIMVHNLAVGTNNYEVYNNVCYDCSTYALQIGNGIDAENLLNTTVKNNILSGTTNDFTTGTNSVTTGGFNCLINDASVNNNGIYTGSADDLYETDPLFTNASGYMNTSTDFQLQWNSLAIDNGTDVNLTQDYEGNTVPQGDEVDIGAYENQYSVGTYYIDASLGNDSWNGNVSGGDFLPNTCEDDANSSDCTDGPWQTISKVNAASFSPGDNIYFEKGEVWREQLTVPSSGNSTHQITFGAYGSGEKPIINGADLITGWEENETNVWNATLTSTPEMVFFDESGAITWGDQKGSVGALVDEYDWYYDSGNNLLYCYAATDPDSRYTSVEASLRFSCIDWGSGVDRSYITIEDLELKFAKSDGVLIRSVSGASTGNIVNNCTIHYIGDNGASKAGDGIEFQGCSGNKAINNTVHECGRHGIFVIGYGAAADNNIIEYNTVYDHWYGAIDHLVDDGDPQSVDGTIIRYNHVYNTGAGDFPGIHAKGNTGVSVTNSEIYYNIIHDIDDEGIKIHTLVSGLKIYNNIIAVTTISTSAGIYVSSLGTVDIKNNIIYDPQKYAMNIVDSTNVTVDNNCLYLPGGFLAYADGGERNWAYWQGTLGFDTNGIISDPKLFNYTNNDFHLQSDSPCIDNGTDVNLTQDYEGNLVPQGSAPDIGAYEYQYSVGTYYIDASLGNDSWNGNVSGGDFLPNTCEDDGNSSDCTDGPWKTISKVNAASFNPGNNIYFKRNETWREQLTVPSSGNSTDRITFGAYGSGADPIITGADLITGWEENETNVWEKTGVTYSPKGLWFDDVYGDEKGSKGALVNEYDWFWESGTNTSFVYSTTDPDSAYTEVEGAERQYGININQQDYIIIDGLHVRYQGGDNTDPQTRGISSTGGGNSEYITIQNTEVDNVEGINIYFGNCDNLYFDNIKSHHCRVQHGLYVDGLSASGTDNVTIENSEFYNNSGSGIQFNGNGAYQVHNPIIRYNKLYDNGPCGIQDLSSLNGQYYYNLIWGNTDGIKLNYDSSDDPTHSVPSANATVYNNVIYVENNDQFGIYITAWATGHLIKNNIIYGETTINKLIRKNTNGSATIDYNSYYHPTFTSKFYWEGNLYNSLADWQIGSSQDANSTNSDPSFVNISNNDFTLQSGSPCIDNGTDVNLTQDYEGNTVPQGSAPDIGAYEYQYSVGTYYIDASLGNDSWNGNVSGGDFLPNTCEDDGNSSDCTDGPWKTISKVNSMSFDPGDSILFKRNETWREQLTIPSSGNSTDQITFGAYGSGDLPIINGANVETGWGLYSGSTYSKTWTDTELVVVEDGGILYKGSGKDSLTSGQFYADGSDLYVRCTNDADPDTHTMQVSARSNCIIGTSKNYITIDGISVKYSEQGTLGVVSSTNWIIQNCTVTASRSTGISTDISNCAPITISNNTITQSGRESIYLGIGTLTTGTVTISGNTITDGGWEGGEGDAIDVKADNTATINITDNTISWAASGLPTMDRTGIVSNVALNITGNTISNFNRRGIYVPTNSTITKNMISTAVTGQSNYLVGIRGGGATLTINYNIIFMPNAETSGVKLGMYWYNVEASGTNVYNNVIYGVDRGIDVELDLTTSKIKNNIILEYSDMAYRFLTTPTGLTIDYNCIYSTDGGADIGRWGGTTENTWAGWQSTSSQDANSINSDPLFVNTSNDDFHLQSDSPCIDNGTDVGLTQDFEGNLVPQGDGVDIGAYESTDTAAPKWFDNSINGTTAGTYIEHRVRWTDVGLSGYIFEFDNGTGTFNNDSFVAMTGTQNWSNVSKVVNSTEGSTIRWRVYANDTASPTNWNSTDIFQYDTTGNNPPTHTTPGIISTSGNNLTTDNITCYNQSTSDADGDNVTNIYNWYRNGSSITVLNMPFDTNFTAIDNSTVGVKDYSGYNNNGTLGNSTTGTQPTWNSSCIKGGCYEFDGSNDYIDFNSPVPTGNTSVTVSFWLKAPEQNMKCIISDGLYESNGWYIWLQTNRFISLTLNNDSGAEWISSNTYIYDDDVWTQITLVFNQSEVIYYKNGTEFGSRGAIEINWTAPTSNFRIGDYISGGSEFNGTIDEVRIYNHSLSADQIYQLYLEGKNNYTNSTIVASETSTGENWTCSITPNDATDDGTTRNSSTMGIVDIEIPKWFDNSINGTTAGTYIEHRVRWTDVGLSGYIFEFDNGTGTFNNDSFVAMTGTQNWSNVSKVVNSTEGSTIRWRVYANDTASPTNWNSTDIFQYDTTSAANYYVNATTGSDASDGLTPATAWKTISKVNGFSFSAGDNIYFERGQTWREQLTVPSSGNSTHQITFGAYGSGAKPIINGADLMTTWVTHDTNVWKKTGVTTDPYVIGFDGTYGEYESDKANLSANYEWNWDTDILYVYTDGGDPDTQWPSGIDVAQRGYGIYANTKDYIDINDIDFRYFLYSAVGFTTVTYSNVDNCIIFANGGNGITAQTSSDNNTFSNITWSYGSRGIAIVASDSNTVEHCDLSESRATGKQPGGGGIKLFTNSNSNIIRYNYVHDARWVSPNRQGDGINLDQDTADCDSNEIYYNIIATHNDGMDICGDSNEIYNNVFYKNQWPQYWIGNGASNNIIKNNILYDSVTNNQMIHGDDCAISNTIENNCYYDPDVPSPSSGNVILWGLAAGEEWGAMTWDAWVAHGKYDQLSIYADPLFVNASNDDFTLQSGSPCIDNGTDVNLTQDYAGNIVPQGSAPDIGAYEYNDITSPNITSISSSVTSSTATVTWTTEESANSTVYYGTTTATTSTSSSATLLTSHSIGLTSLSSSTFYYYNVSSCDASNNCNTSTQYNFTTSAAGDGGNGGNGGNGRGSSWGYPIFKPTQEQLEEGYEKSLRKNWTIQFEFNNETHIIKLDNIINKTAIITISSEPVTFNLTVNETKKFNLDDNNYYDLQIFLKNIGYYEANLVVKLIHEEIPAEEFEEKIEEKSKWWLWGVVVLIIIIVIIIITIIILIIRYKHKRRGFEKISRITNQRFGRT